MTEEQYNAIRILDETIHQLCRFIRGGEDHDLFKGVTRQLMEDRIDTLADIIGLMRIELLRKLPDEEDIVVDFDIWGGSHE